MNNLDAGFEFLMKQNHVGIVYGVLKRLNIRVDNPQFDDLKQEGFIHLATKYSQYNDELDDDRVCGYLFQAVYWHLLDILRKQQRTNNHVINSVRVGANHLWKLEKEVNNNGKAMGQVKDYS